MGFLNICHNFLFPSSSASIEQDEQRSTDHRDEIAVTSKAKEILQMLQDPITLEMFKQPGILNCGHSLNKESYDQLKKLAADNSSILCPICQQKVSDWIPNYTLQQLCNLIQNK